MARKDALLRLHKVLTERRAELMKRLGVEIRDLGMARLNDQSGDVADAAFDAGSNEIGSQLAEFEARELNQVHRALARLKQGTYGTCEACQRKIPVARLNAVPYSTMCVPCQRDLEEHGEPEDGYGGDWDRVADTERRYSNSRDVHISDIEMDYSR